MKLYAVDLRGLEPSERLVAAERIDGFAFQMTQTFGANGLEGLEVYWDSNEDFPSSAVFPTGCPYRLIK